jgi:hypothetical protein
MITSLYQKVEASTIHVIEEYGLPTVAPKSDMIECPRKVGSWLPGHVVILRSELQKCEPDPRSVVVYGLEKSSASFDSDV